MCEGGSSGSGGGGVGRQGRTGADDSELIEEAKVVYDCLEHENGI
jgi:hypothetical protein